METLQVCKTFFTKLANASHLQLHGTILNEALKGRADSIPCLVSAYTAYKAAYQAEDYVYKKQQKFLETEDIASLDKQRDAHFRAIKQAAHGAQKSLKADIKQAAREVSNIFHKYPKSNSIGYEKETAEVKNLLEDLRSSAMQENLKKIDLVEAVEELKVANEAFEKVYNERSTKKQSELDKGDLLAARRSVDEAYMAIQSCINALYVQNSIESKDPERTALLEEIMARVKAFVNQTQRTGRHKSSEPQPGPKPPTPPTPSIPELSVESQAGSEPFPGGGYLLMDVFMPDSQWSKLSAFSETMKNARVHLRFDPTGVELDVSIKGFAYTGLIASGFRLNTPDKDTYYMEPLSFLDDEVFAVAEMYSDKGEVLCTFKGMKFPIMML